MRGVLLFCVLSAGACSFDRAGLGSGSGAVDAPVGTSDGRTIDADPSAPDAPPGAPDACVPSCGADGTLHACAGPDIACELGCGTTGGVHCLTLVPSNGATEDDLTGVTDGLLADANTFVFPNTDTGEIYVSNGQNNFTLARTAGDGVISGIGYYLRGGIAIFAIDSLTVEADSYMRPYGSRPVIFLSRGAVTISGLLDMSGGCTTTNNFDRACAGPGGGTGGKPGMNGGAPTPATGCGPGGNGTHTTNGPDAGAGGGAMAVPGAAGGAGGATGVATVAGGPGGSAAACVGATLVPLAGGAGGGMGGNGAVGGGGGGAIQITSFTSITIASDPGAQAPAQLDAAGRGGQGSATSGGGGGGAGGAILLEAPAISIAGNVTANGGGGGSGRVSTNSGTKGSSTSAVPAPGGAGDSVGGDGGAGGAAAIAPVVGSGLVDGGGGGGGAYGRIRLNVPASALTTTGGLVSPAAVRGDLPLQ